MARRSRPKGLRRMSLKGISGRLSSWRTIRLSRIHMVARYWDYIPGRRDLPPGIRFEELDQVRVSEIAPDEENGMVWERLVENWHEEHWERRTPWRGSSNFRVLRRAGPETSGSSSAGSGGGGPPGGG